MAVERLTQLQLDGFADAFKAADPEEISEEARQAFEVLAANDGKAFGWMSRYQQLARQRIPWRIAVYIAWASIPKADRLPKTQDELAKQVLGLTSDRVLITWRAKYPDIDKMIAQLQSNELFEHRADIFEALIKSASDPNYKSHQDRRLAFEMLGDYSQKIQVEDHRKSAGVDDVSSKSDAELNEDIKQAEIARKIAAGEE
jgi:hypothetical protein